MLALPYLFLYYNGKCFIWVCFGSFVCLLMSPFFLLYYNSAELVLARISWKTLSLKSPKILLITSLPPWRKSQVWNSTIIIIWRIHCHLFSFYNPASFFFVSFFYHGVFCVFYFACFFLIFPSLFSVVISWFRCCRWFRCRHFLLFLVLIFIDSKSVNSTEHCSKKKEI